LDALAVSAADRAITETAAFEKTNGLVWSGLGWMGQSFASHRYVVLIVEDDVFVRMDLAAELSAAGWSVLEAASGRQALNVCESGEHVDLLLTDINLGVGMTGWDVARTFWLRESTPVIYMSAVWTTRSTTFRQAGS